MALLLNRTIMTESSKKKSRKPKEEVGPETKKIEWEDERKVKVNYRDGKPAADYNISISISNYNNGERYEKYYLSDPSGEVKFTLPPASNRKSFTVRATASDFTPYASLPSDSLFVKSWYSPSGSYLQLSPQPTKLKCGSKAQLDLVYTTNVKKTVNLSVIIIGPGDITNSYQETVDLDTDYPVGTAVDSILTWDKTAIAISWYYPKPIPFPGESSTTSTPSFEKTTPTPTVAEFYGSIGLELSVDAAMSPEANILVYYIAADGEIVSDSMQVDVETCTANKVAMQFSTNEGQPDDDIVMTIKASPSSLCAYSTVDKSVHLKSGDNQLDISMVSSALHPYTLSQYSGPYEPDTYCEKKSKGQLSHRRRLIAPPPPPEPPLPEIVDIDEPELIMNDDMASVENDRAKFRRSIFSPYGRSYSEYVDSKQAFKGAGVVVMSDLTLETRTCVQPEVYPQFMPRYGLPGRSEILYSKDIVYDDEVPLVVNSVPTGGSAGNSDRLPSVSVRNYFPELWLWDLVTTGENGEAEVGSKLPHTITEWVGKATCINKELGLGVSETASVTTFQSFFLSATLPYSAVRQEQVPIGVTVFNYLMDCLPVRVQMKSSSQYQVVSSASNTICVCGRRSVTSDFLVRLDDVGSINMTMTAVVVSNDGICSGDLTVRSDLVGIRDTVIQPMISEPEGAPRDYTLSEFICFDDPADNTMRDIELPLPSSAQLIADSQRAFVSVVGDVMGPALSNFDDLLRMPYGCGEQNMIGFVPNIYVLQYLEAVGRVTDDIRSTALMHMKKGYQRELNYRHPDGSYSAFGPGADDGSTWLTAFVVKSFAQASPYIFIDNSLQTESIQFFKQHQKPNGCFSRVGMVHHGAMRGGLHNNENSAAPLTAYVLIAMLEAGLNISDTSVSQAISCLDVQSIDNDYTLALMVYAYALADPDSSTTTRLYQRLWENAITERNTVHWTASEDSNSANGYNCWYYQPSSADVETSSYALLATLILSDDTVSDGLSIATWLSKQRNGYGGFGSTQDTVLGLQALSEFAKRIQSDQAEFTISIRQSDVLQVQFDINSGNSFVYHEFQLPDTNSISVATNGSGCFLLQVHVKYNVQIVQDRKEAFSLSVKDFRSDHVSNPCKQRKLHLCTRYIGQGASSNMVVIHVKMMSGWEAVSTSLKSLLKNKRVGIRRYDVEKNGDIQLYFTKLTRKRACFSFDVLRVLDVKDAKPAFVRIYDYYKKELTSESKYHIFSSHCVDKTNTKSDLPDVSEEEYLNSVSQQRQPMELSPPWLARLQLDTADKSSSCPTCHMNAEEFDMSQQSICGFSKVYKVYWRTKSNYPLKLMADLRPSSGKRRIENSFMNYDLPQNCSCVTMFNAEKGDKLALLVMVDEDPEDEGTISLGGEAVVLPLDRAMERNITSAARQC